ncbi:MAG: helix-turn-helix domain-containing protein [bacterium]|nr:helix-turn-helix domain-containing protein [bacterium]
MIRRKRIGFGPRIGAVLYILCIAFVCACFSPLLAQPSPGQSPEPATPSFELSLAVDISGASPARGPGDAAGDFTRGSGDCAAMLRSASRREWKALTSNVLNLGFSGEAHWLRLRILRNAGADSGQANRFIIFQQQMLGEVMLCDPRGGARFAGADVPFHEWPQRLRFPAFRLMSPAASEQVQAETRAGPRFYDEYYFRLRSQRILNFPVRVFVTLEDYLDFIQSRQIAQFGLLGIAALGSLLYAGWYIASAQRLYLYFFALMTAVTLNFFIVYGDAYIYFWPDSPELQNTAVKFTTALAALFAAMFSRPLLNSHELPRLDAGIKAVIFAQCVSLVCALIPALELVNRLIMFVSPFAGLLLVVPAALLQLRRGQLPARMYLAGWLIVLSAFVLNASNFLGWTEYNAFFVNAPVLSAPLAMIFFALGSYRRSQAEYRQTLYLRRKYDELTRRLQDLDRPRNPAGGAQSQLGGVAIHEKKALLLQAMQSERLYELEDLRLESLAAHVGLRSHQLSELLNQELNISFVDFVRKFRIDAAREKLADPDNSDSVLQIGLSVGFGSKTAFHRGFTELTGMTPGRYREQSRRG